MKTTYAQILVFVACLLGLLPVPAFSSDQPYWPDQTWRVSTPEEQGIDSTMIADMVQHIIRQQIAIHSFLLIRDSYLVTEAYFAPYSREVSHPLYSCTKSFTSALIGIALDEGRIKGIDQKIFDFFDPTQVKDLDTGKQEITIAHLLTMTSGLKPTPSFPLYQYAEPIPFVLNLPMIHAPGEEFAYNSAALHLLPAILRQTTGIEVLTYANTKLFTPLGIADVRWDADSTGLNMGGTGLSLRPCDLAKFGYLYLRHGLWNGQQIISQEWIDLSTQKHVETAGKMNAAENDGYGYLWWMNGFDGYAAHGFGGQYLFVMPALDLIVVFTAGLADPDFPKPYELVKTYILPAVKSDTALPPHSQASQALERSVVALEHPEPQPVAPLPEIAQQISGKTFQITQSSYGYMFKTITLTFTDGPEYTVETLWPDGTRAIVRGGLDQVFRMNTVVVNQQPVKSALKGFWQDDHTFVQYLQDFSQIDTTRYTCTFDRQNLSIEVTSSMGAYAFQAKGEMID
jgi:CubicO group peptidase (beta-lactamase class C family)